MANEIKRISVSAMERIIKASDEPELIELNWHGETILVKYRLSLKEMMLFVDTVVGNCFTDNRNYFPEVEGFSRRCAILEIYGNFRLPQDLEKRYEFVYSNAVTEAADMIVSKIDQAQYTEILDVIQDKIDYRINTDIEKANLKVQELVSSLSSMEATFKGMFEDMSAEDVKNLIGVLSQGVDEEKIVNAYMDRKEKAEAGEDSGNVISFNDVEP